MCFAASPMISKFLTTASIVLVSLLKSSIHALDIFFYFLNSTQKIIYIKSVVSLHMGTASFNIPFFIKGFNVSFMTKSTFVSSISLKRFSNLTNSKRSIIS